MKTIGSFEVRTHFAELLERVDRGEEFAITEHGKPVARLAPIAPARPKPDVRAAVEALKRLRQGQTLGDLTVLEMIEEGRRF